MRRSVRPSCRAVSQATGADNAAAGCAISCGWMLSCFNAVELQVRTSISVRGCAEIKASAAEGAISIQCLKVSWSLSYVSRMIRWYRM